MAEKERSPRYPAVDLGEALASVQGLYESEGKTALTGEDAAKALGFKGLTGPARSRLGALRKYGLVESAGHGMLRVSARALAILVEPEDSHERTVAVREAALAPELFRELYESHLEASDQSRKSYLIRNKGFTRRGAEFVSESFRKTVEFANLVQSKDNLLRDGSLRGEAARAEESMHETVTQNRDGRAALTPSEQAGGVLWLKVPFGGSSMLVRVEVAGEMLSKAHIARVRQYLELAEDDLPDQAGG